MGGGGRKARKLTPQQRSDIVSTAKEIRRRRKALGVTQSAIDRECGFSTRVTFYAESLTVDHRSILPTDEKVAAILGALGRLEKSPPTKVVSIMRRGASALLRSKHQVARNDEPTTLTATIKRCPDHSVWITQAGCDAMRETNAICRSLRGGTGCRGVAHRRRLERKDIEVEYKPPTPAELEDRPKRFGGIS